MSNGLRVLRHAPSLPESTIRALAGTEPKVPGFPEWLDNGHPRHSFLSEEIMDATTEYAVADMREIHATFETLAEAEAAAAGAKVTFGVSRVELPEPEKAPEPTPVAQTPAPAPEPEKRSGIFGGGK